MADDIKTKRITEYDEATTFGDNDYIFVDNADLGTRKIKSTMIKQSLATDQQIAAIEAAGQAARESIPGTYTELSDEVDELKSAFSEAITPIESKSGYYFSIWGTGFVSNGGFKSYIYQITPGKEYIAEANASGAANVCLIALTSDDYSDFVYAIKDGDCTSGTTYQKRIKTGRFTKVIISVATEKKQSLVRPYISEEPTTEVTKQTVALDKYLRNDGTGINDASGFLYCLFPLDYDSDYYIESFLTGGGSVVPIALTNDDLSGFLFLATSQGGSSQIMYSSLIHGADYGNYTKIIISIAANHSDDFHVYRTKLESPIIDSNWEIKDADSTVYGSYLRNDGSGINQLSGLSYSLYDFNPDYDYYVVNYMTGGGSVVPIALANDALTRFEYIELSTGSTSLYRYNVEIHGNDYPEFTKLIISSSAPNNKTSKYAVYKSKSKTSGISSEWIRQTPTNIYEGEYLSKWGTGIVSPSSPNSNFLTSIYNISPEYQYRAVCSIKGTTNVALISLSNDDVSEYQVLATGSSDNSKVFEDIVFSSNTFSKVVLSTYRAADTGKTILYRSKNKIYNSLNLFQSPYIKAEMEETENNTIADMTSLTGKMWNAVGDSITARGDYEQLVCTRLGLSFTNCGVSSSTVAINNTYLENKSMVERVLGLNGNTPYGQADIWTVFGGLNDVYYDTPIGDLSDSYNTTFYGALKAICEYIRRQPNNPKLVLITPTHSFLDETKLDAIRAVVRSIHEVGQLYSAKVIDLYNESGICYANLRNVTEDRLHWNTIGNTMVYPLISNGMKDIL